MSRRAPPRDIYERDVYERDRYDDRGPRRGDRHAFEEDVECRQRAPEPPRVRELERVREPRAPPRDFMGEAYGRSSSAGPLVVSRDIERERDEYSSRRPPASQPRARESDFVERDEYIMRRERDYSPDDNYATRPKRARSLERRRYDDYPYGRVSHERERPRARSDEREEIIIRRDERERNRGRRDTEMERDEIIIRREQERSPSPEMISPPTPPPVRAPPIHQDVVTHHRHIDHGYEVVPRPPVPEPPSREEDIGIDIRRRGERGNRVYDEDIHIDIDRESSRRRPRAPVVDRPPAPRRRSTEDEVIISHSHTRRPERERDTDIVMIRDRDRGIRDRRDAADIREEAAYYNNHVAENATMGEAYNGATRDWSIVDVPPGTKRVTMDGIGGASEEISWQRYNGVRRAKFIPEGDSPPIANDRDAERARIGRRYVGVKDKRDELWTEITKDLVVKEAIEKAGYDYEETEYFYYVFAYLRYEDVSDLISISEDYRRARRDRIREIQRERAALGPPPVAAPPPRKPPLMIERGPTREWDDVYEHEHETITDTWGPPRSLPIRGGRRW